VRLVWSDIAREDLEGIHAFIAKTSLESADKTLDRLLGVAADLLENPELGEPITHARHENLRAFGERPYRFYYRVLPHVIEVVCVDHSIRNAFNKPLR
jgi:plasmid stabilization system protein ParE